MAELQKPKIIRIETVAQSRLFTVQSVALKFSNGANGSMSVCVLQPVNLS